MSIDDKYFKDYFYRTPSQSELNLFASFIGDRIANTVDFLWEEINQGAKDDVDEILSVIKM